ncbi:MAG: tRNA (adenosine(37)-N6)-threonylcarbamoyltransferase complex dimerization subunit type 1 TsaB [Gemmatimonadales bacterium]|nr:tRNA (adenosine(37)-N6)-threonylcarbamoyltransferase complex dimerization subunit type 1 TsaB [Gemmatimonadales bacterium]
MWLAMDTATDRLSVALGTSVDQADEESLGGARRHGAALLPMIESLLRRRGATLDDVSGLALSDGPGSFTGLRVGASLVKALVQSRGLPLWTAPSLLVRAAGPAGEGSLVLAVTNALRGEVYAAAYRFQSGGIETVLSPTVQQPEALLGCGIAPDLLVGEAPPTVVELLERGFDRTLWGPPEGAPSARALIGLVGRRGGASRVEMVQGWEPVYGRPAEAQARWETAHGRTLPDSVGSSL